MAVDVERRRALVAVRASEGPSLQQLFAAEALGGWEAVEADSFDRARFLLQHTLSDLLIVDEGLYLTEGPEGMAWLARQREVPMIFLAGSEPETLARAYERGATLCLPRQMTLAYPPLLAAAMQRAMLGSDLLRTHRRTRESLHQCRRQIDRLVGLLWRTAPVDTQNHWCTQRHVLERLQEEIARTERHGGPLTLAVGELCAGDEAEGRESASLDLTEWMTTQITRTKRRCDVAGQYGLQGFLLLMVQTPKEGSVTCCRRLRQALEQAAVGPDGPRGPIRACFGVATLGAETATSQALLSTAEQHLEAARAGAPDRVVAG